MQTWEEKILDRERGKAEGKAEGILSLLEDLGEIPSELREIIFNQRDLKILDIWLKLAARADSIESFWRQIG